VMERIEQDVRRALQRFSAPGGLPAVLEVWPEAVGPEISRNAWPARIARDGTLHVATSSSAWAFELSQLAPDVLEKLGDRLGDAAPGALRFAPGRLPEPAPSAIDDVSRRSPEPGPKEVAEAYTIVAGIDDQELRERVRRAAELSLMRNRSGRSFW
jgi:hypothetical protein